MLFTLSNEMLFLVFLTGFFLLSRLSLKLSPLERVGFGLPVGLGAITMCMLLMDWVNIPLDRTNLTFVTLALLLISAASLWPIRKRFAHSMRLRPLDLSWFNLVWLLLFAGVLFMEYVNITKCLVYPTYDRDSMAAFDTFGYVCAQEHTYHNMSIFQADYMPSLHHAGSAIAYIPMLQLSYAYVYVFGAITSKAIPAFVYLGFLIGLYGLFRHRLSHTGSMLALMGIILTPEMTSFASLSTTNVMQACLAAPAAIYICLWLNHNRMHYLLMGSLMLALNQWMRAEGMVFTLVALLLVFIKVLRTKQWRSVLWPVLAGVPLVVWAIYSKVHALDVESAIITHPFWDSEKLSAVAAGAWRLLSFGDYYGWTFNAALIALIADAWLILHRKDSGTMILYIILALMAYFLVLYHIDYKWDSIDNVLAYSAKRFMFCFVPMAWYFTVSIRPMRRFMHWLERLCGLGNSASRIYLWPTKSHKPNK